MVTVTGFHIITFQQLIEKQGTRKKDVLNGGTKAQREKDRPKATQRTDARAKSTTQAPWPQHINSQIRHSNRAGCIGCLRKAANVCVPTCTDTYAYTHTHIYILVHKEITAIWVA